GETIQIDSRPSDAIALAIRCRVPILVSSEILEVAGFVPEQEIDVNATQDEPETLTEEPAEESEDRLSVFEDFLDSLDQGDSDTEPPVPDSDEPDPDKA
nr:bifunctional nuclease family protein [Anaerolineaceae bacterium]